MESKKIAKTEDSYSSNLMTKPKGTKRPKTKRNKANWKGKETKAKRIFRNEASKTQGGVIHPQKYPKKRND